MTTQSQEIAPPSQILSGFKFTEGPAANAAGELFFTDQPNDRIMVLRSGREEADVFLSPSGRSNGMFFDQNDILWSCADDLGALWRIRPDGSSEVAVDSFQGSRLNGPNDVWVAPNGGAYITDPFYQRDYWSHSQPTQPIEGVYYLPPGKSELILVDGTLTKPNGIIGTRDGGTLLVADIRGNKTWHYTIAPDGSLTDKTLFCEMGSDGMTLDREGRLYITGKGVTIFDTNGTQVGHIPINEPWTSNVTFGGADGTTLFITASTKVYAVPAEELPRFITK